MQKDYVWYGCEKIDTYICKKKEWSDGNKTAIYFHIFFQSAAMSLITDLLKGVFHHPLDQ